MQKIKKGDEVKVLIGKDRGKTGIIERFLPKKDRAVILGINVYKRHVKKQGGMEGGTIDLSKSVNISNLELICPSCKKPTRVGIKIMGDEKIRFCKKCNKEITTKQEAKK